MSYLRVSTPGQVESDLSLPAQRHAVADYAARRGAAIEREYEEAGHSGADPHRPMFRQMIQDVLAPSSQVAVIVVHHTSRFSRDATEARVVKRTLRKAGVRVLSVCQDIHDDPIGRLVEGIFECIDEYESDAIGIRTAASLDELVRQGFFPGRRPPYGFDREPVEVRPGVVRHRLVRDDEEATIARELFQLYIAGAGSKGVARALNQRGHTYRGRPWSKDRVLDVLSNPAVSGTFLWRRHPSQRGRAAAEPIAVPIEAIVDRGVYDLAQRVRATRNPSRSPGRGTSPGRELKGLLYCGKCGAAYQLETSGKKIAKGVYTYCYYNCRTSLRVGKERWCGYRIRTQRLDEAVLASLAKTICSPARAKALGALLPRSSTAEPGLDAVAIAVAWRELVTQDAQVGHNYLRHLVERIMVHENRIVLVPRVVHSPASEKT